MNTHRKHIAIFKAASWLLCILFVLQVANRSVYYHAHIAADGRVVYHAHPYNKSSDTDPIKQHSHSACELLCFSQLELLFFIGGALSALITLFISSSLFLRACSTYYSGFVLHAGGRAPPAFIML